MTEAGQEHLQWRKSSRSGDTGGQCIEVAPLWRKSSRSGDTGGECVEVAAFSPSVAVRDSKNPDGPMLTFDNAAWTAFTGMIKTGRHDLR